MQWPSRTVIIILFAAVVNGFSGQDKPWLRPISDWSEKDVQKILTDSPWAQMQEELNPDPFYRGKAQGPKFQIVCRFLSAKTIRQALYRSIELNRMSTTSQIEAARGFMESQYADTIVISVGYAGPRYPQQANMRFSQPTTALLRNDTYLTLSSGRRLFLKEYQPPGQDGLGAKFIFERYVDGQPFIGPKDKIVRFDVECFKIQNLQFKVADMTVAGILQY